MVEHLLSRLDTLIPLVCAMSVMEMKSDIGPRYSDVSSLVLFVLFILFPHNHGYIETDVSFSNSDVLSYGCCMKLPSASDDELSVLVSQKMKSATIKMTKKTIAAHTAPFLCCCCMVERIYNIFAKSTAYSSIGSWCHSSIHCLCLGITRVCLRSTLTR